MCVVSRWASARAAGAVSDIVIRELLGYNTRLVQAAEGDSKSYEYLARQEADLNFELYPALKTNEKESAKQIMCIVDASEVPCTRDTGTLGYQGRSGWFTSNVSGSRVWMVMAICSTASMHSRGMRASLMPRKHLPRALPRRLCPCRECIVSRTTRSGACQTRWTRPSVPPLASPSRILSVDSCGSQWASYARASLRSSIWRRMPSHRTSCTPRCARRGLQTPVPTSSIGREQTTPSTAAREPAAPVARQPSTSAQRNPSHPAWVVSSPRLPHAYPTWMSSRCSAN